MDVIKSGVQKNRSAEPLFDSEAFPLADDAPGSSSVKGRRLIEKHESALQVLFSAVKARRRMAVKNPV